MKIVVVPGNPLSGTVLLPGDKSLSHRAALFAAIAEGESRIENFLVAGVTHALLDALTALGIEWYLDGTTLTVLGNGLRGFQPPSEPINCGNSGTTMRLLVGAIAASGIPATLDGSTGLRHRPMGRIVEPLQQMGVDITATDGQYAPLSLASSPFPLYPLSFALPIASAQVKSCLLLAALAADGPSTLTEPGPSRDHTERLVRSMGVSVTSGQLSVTSDQISVKSGKKVSKSQITNQQSPTPNPQYTTTLTPPHPLSLTPLHLTLPGDISSAAFLIVAALITPGSEITLKGVGLNPTRIGLLDALKRMGAQLQISSNQLQHNEPIGDLTVHHSQLHGVEIDGPLVVRMIDEFPAFAIAAAYAHGPTTVREAEELRYKESDRIAILCEQLRAIGIEIHEVPDGFTLPGNTPPRGGWVRPHGDHRLAMSLAIAGLAAQSPIVIQDAQIIQESFPGFKATLEFLGADTD